MGRWRRTAHLSLTHSALSLSFTSIPNLLRRPWRWRRRHGRRLAPVSSELPRRSHLPNQNRCVQIYRSVPVVFPFSSSPGESPPFWISWRIASTNSGELSSSPTMGALLGLTWRGCCSQYSCRRLRCSLRWCWVRRRNVGAYPGFAAVRAARALPRHALASASRRK